MPQKIAAKNRPPFYGENRGRRETDIFAKGRGTDIRRPGVTHKSPCLTEEEEEKGGTDHKGNYS